MEPEINFIIKSISKIIETEQYKVKKNSREIIKTFFNWNRVALETVKVYEEVIQTHQSIDCDFFTKETFLNPTLITLSFFRFVNKSIFYLYDQFKKLSFYD